MPFSHSIHDHRHIHDHDHDHHVHYHDHHHVFDHNQHGHQHLHDEYLNHITDLVPIVPVKTVDNAPANLKIQLNLLIIYNLQSIIKQNNQVG